MEYPNENNNFNEFENLNQTKNSSPFQDSNLYNSQKQYQEANQISFQSLYQDVSQNNTQNLYHDLNQFNTQNVQQDLNKSNVKNVNQKNESQKLLSPWAYVGYNLLFMIPVIGWIFLFVFSFNNKNINRRNFSRSYFCNLLVAIIIGAVLVVPISILINSSSNTVKQAQYASFIQKIGEFTDAITINKADIKGEYAISGIVCTDAQIYYELAKGEAPSRYFSVPYGETLNYDFLDDNEQCYLITDYSKILEYFNYDEGHRFNLYGDEYDGERHYISSKGKVFTLPGYEEKQSDGTVRYYVNSRGDYYTK